MDLLCYDIKKVDVSNYNVSSIKQERVTILLNFSRSFIMQKGVSIPFLLVQKVSAQKAYLNKYRRYVKDAKKSSFLWLTLALWASIFNSYR